MRKIEHNYGIDLLRIWMSFEVILMHFWKDFDSEKLRGVRWFLYKNEIFAVPVFMIVAFFYFEQACHGNDEDVGKLSKRMKRLLIPFWSWGVIYIIGTFLYEWIVYGESHLGISDYLWQMILGCSEHINPTLYFMFDLISLSTVGYFIGHISQKVDYRRFCYYIVFIVGFKLQFMPSIIGMFTGDSFERYISGRIIEMIPFAAIGLIIGSSDILAYLRKHKGLYIFVLVLLYLIILKYLVFYPANTGFGYSGMRLSAVGGILVLFFLTLPVEKLHPVILSGVRYISRFSFGIYCLHWGVGKLMNIVFPVLRGGVLCGLIWGLSIAICILIDLMPYRFTKMLIS